MPAIITHDQFALDVLAALDEAAADSEPASSSEPAASSEPLASSVTASTASEPAASEPSSSEPAASESAAGSFAPRSPEERLALRLGSQGPDPFFYLAVHPTLHARTPLGSALHSTDPADLLAALSTCVTDVPERERPIARSWAAGFLCHYLLDRTVHPFVYAQEYAYCDAGIEGLTRENGSEVHAVIESEIDEVVLFTKRGVTVDVYSPHREILRLDDYSLGVASRLVSRMMWTARREQLPLEVYAAAVRSFRFVQSVFDSPSGVKRSVLGSLEELVRPYSFVRSMIHRPLAVTECDYDNHERAEWENPFTGERSEESFWDLYAAALDRAVASVGRLASGELDENAARELTAGLNFSGAPVL